MMEPETVTAEEHNTTRQMLADLERRLVETLNAGITALTLSIANLTETHHKSLLEQERRNSQFAPRDRVDDLARRVDRAEAQSERITRLEQAIQKLADAISNLDQRTATAGMKLLGGLTGYLILALITLASVLITYFLARGR